jgi:mannose-6-phosphate isomerase
MSLTAPYPLPLTPLLFAKVWGGDRLARLGKAVAPGATIGESWELADMPSTSASGAGGSAARTLIADGPLKGLSLLQAGEALPAGSLLGRAGLIDGAFPLLVKFLDARENLSVQVHPSPAYAQAHAAAGAKLKTECWYILDAEPGSVIYKGIKPGVSRERFEAAVRSAASGSSVVDLLEAIPAVPGECHNLPSGTVHALGAGVLVAEVQTPSDTTYRLYDWGRAGREMHFEAGLASAAAAWDAHEGPRLSRGATVARFSTGSARDGWSRLVSTEFFTLDEAQPDATGSPASLACAEPAASAPVAIIVLAGSATLRHQGQSTRLHTGSTCLIPASIAGQTTLAPERGLRVLRATVAPTNR